MPVGGSIKFNLKFYESNIQVEQPLAELIYFFKRMVTLLLATIGFSCVGSIFFAALYFLTARFLNKRKHQKLYKTYGNLRVVHLNKLRNNSKAQTCLNDRRFQLKKVLKVV